MSITARLCSVPSLQARFTEIQQEDFQGAFGTGYNAGYAEGKDAGYAEGIEAGKKSEYDKFWDIYQDYGNRTNYDTAFFSQGWTDETFRPKYDMAPVGSNGGYNMFRASKITDLVSSLEQNGVNLDMSNAANLYCAFNAASTATIPTLDLGGCTSLGQTFYNMKDLTALHIVNLREDCTYDRTFSYTTAITDLTISGVIGKNGLSVSSCTKLTHDSLMSIINALKDYSDSGTTYTLTLGAANLAKLTDSEKAIATEKGWTLA